MGTTTETVPGVEDCRGIPGLVIFVKNYEHHQVEGHGLNAPAEPFFSHTSKKRFKCNKS